MNAELFTQLFLALLAFVTSIQIWLALRHLNHIQKHQTAVPTAFSGQISLESHQKAAAYTSCKTRFGLINIVFHVVILLLFTLGGGIQWCHELALSWSDSQLLQGVLTIGLVVLISSVLEIPLGLYSTFVIEEKFGFNKITLSLYIKDGLKGLLVGMALGLPLLCAVLWLMNQMGTFWWIYVWLVWVVFNLSVLFIYPSFIAPIFNKFTPMQEGETKQRIEQLLSKCGFHSGGLFVMDGSTRSAHGNAYFTGFGKNKRIVFFDTLLEKLSINEIEAVLAHELGHFKHKHVFKMIVSSFIMSLVFLWLLAQLLQTTWFFNGLGVSHMSTATGLMLFFMVLPLISFVLQPIMARSSRKHEFEADAYAAQHTGAADLIQALVKLYQDNASTLTPDPLYSSFYDSHPPAAIRVAHLESLNRA